ncbi:hypothetical protein GTP91_18000 [Rugamonas sp. FT82W]|uniref:Uncharacterized protein n=1 Tax=Duganella vulcania TaxID=2692166 RepID=A0A845G815_9BURK|nr:hypothetical protein [Duganella vulcania]MYM89057.1 hypothetical protein [Duganella vulcania]
MKQGSKCYACDSEATSREHAPPQCLFPQSKDMRDGRSHRKDLITVPACDEHNLSKSKDDEYLMMILVAHFENNDVAAAQMSGKVLRAWERRPQLAHVAVQKPRTVLVNGKEELAFLVDSKRFDRAMELIARALLFHERSIRWEGPCIVWSPSMFPSNYETARNVLETSRALMEAIPAVFVDTSFSGENPDVFKYRVWLPQPDAIMGFVEMIFYGGFRVCVIMPTSELANELKGGVHEQS